MSDDIIASILKVLERFTTKWGWSTGALLYNTAYEDVKSTYYRENHELSVCITGEMIEFRLHLIEDMPSNIIYYNDKQQFFCFYNRVDQKSYYLSDPKLLNHFRKFAKLRKSIQPG